MFSAKFFEAKFSDTSATATVNHLGYKILDSEDEEYCGIVYITDVYRATADSTIFYREVTLRGMSKDVWESDVGSSYVDTLLAATTKDQLTLPPVKSCSTVSDSVLNVLSCSESY